jgi:DNA-binding MarR family transcriptional regulator
MKRKEEIATEMSQTLPTFMRHMFPYVFQPINLPPSQVIALVSIQERSDCTLTQLRKEMHVAAPTITGIVNRLERDGYLKRHQDKKDRRIVHVVLTIKGLRVIEQFRSNIKKRWEYILSKTTTETAETVLQVLQKITQGFINGSL